MSEAYPSYTPESSSEKGDDKETNKKDRKKRAPAAGVVTVEAPKAESTPSPERPLKLGNELLKPLSIEVPKAADETAKEKEPDKQPEVTAEVVQVAPPGEQALPHDDLQRLQAELAALNPEDDDEPAEKPKQKPEAKAEALAEAPAEPAKAELPDKDQTEAAFQAITQAPELADLAAAELPQVVISPSGEVIPESPPQPAPEVVASNNPDDDFNGIVEHSLDEAAPGPARFHEQAPGEPPIDAEGGDAEPPVPPVSEGGDWDDFGGDEPWRQPAGGYDYNPALDKISAVDAKREMDDLYHTSREHGLAGAIGLVGLGLVIEHFIAKRRDKKLKKQIDAQGRQLKKTNQALQQEHYAHQTTQHKLERVNTAQLTSAEQLRTITNETNRTAEIAAAGIAGGIVAAERGKTHMTTEQEKVLADKLAESRELGQAIARNPELQKAAAEKHQELTHSLEAASVTMAAQERQIDGLKREVNHEHLHSKHRGHGASSRSSVRSGAFDAAGMPMLPMPQDELPSGMDGEHLLEAYGSPDKRSTADIVKPVAIATVLVILAAVIVMVYIR